MSGNLHGQPAWTIYTVYETYQWVLKETQMRDGGLNDETEDITYMTLVQ